MGCGADTIGEDEPERGVHTSTSKSRKASSIRCVVVGRAVKRNEFRAPDRWLAAGVPPRLTLVKVSSRATRAGRGESFSASDSGRFPAITFPFPCRSSSDQRRLPPTHGRGMNGRGMRVSGSVFKIVKDRRNDRRALQYETSFQAVHREQSLPTLLGIERIGAYPYNAGPNPRHYYATSTRISFFLGVPTKYRSRSLIEEAGSDCISGDAFGCGCPDELRARAHRVGRLVGRGE